MSAVAASLTAPAFAGPSDECGAQVGSQVEIYDCLVKVEKNALAALDVVFQRAMEAAAELDKVTGRETVVPALKAERTAWTRYRDKHCDYVGATWGGGSGTGIAILDCRIELIRSRSAVLLKDLPN